MVRCIFLSVTLAACWMAGTLPAQPPAGKKYAVLVGVAKYDHASLPPLQYPEYDVAELGSVLRAVGYNVQLLTGGEGDKDRKFKPTRSNIERCLKAVLDKAGPNDLVLMALAGHGLQFDKVDDSFFCPQDAVPLKDDANRATLLSLKATFHRMEASKAGVKLLLVDACRNDPDPARGRGIDGTKSPQAPQGVAALFSCSAGERAYEHDNYRHGVFFYHVLAGLRGQAKDNAGEVTWDSLQSYVRKQVPGDVNQLLHQKQLPSLNTGELRGEPPVLVAATAAFASRADLASAIDAVDRPTAERWNLAPRTRPQMGFVVPGGGGDRLGLRRGDVVLRVNGRDVTTVSQYTKALEACKLGTRLEFEILARRGTSEAGGAL